MPPKLTEEDKEELEGQKLEPNNLPESPASANVVCWIDGFRTQFTVRDEQVKEVVKRIEYLINEYAKPKGWKPSWKEEPEDKDPDWIKKTDEKPKTKSCNVCEGTRTLKTGVTKGKKWAAWFCENKECPPEWVNLSKK